MVMVMVMVMVLPHKSSSNTKKNKENRKGETRHDNFGTFHTSFLFEINENS